MAQREKRGRGRPFSGKESIMIRVSTADVDAIARKACLEDLTINAWMARAVHQAIAQALILDQVHQSMADDPEPDKP